MNEHELGVGRDLIPQPLKGEMKVQVQLPDPIIQLAGDLHNDRQMIGMGAVVLLGE